MQVTLNIGLEGNLGTGTVLRDLASHKFTLLAHRLHQSDTEQTVVAEVECPVFWENELLQLSRLWNQDCIAVWGYGHGNLIGDRAAAWGEFNPAAFIQLDGSRLQ